MHWSRFKGIVLSITPIHPAMLSEKGYTINKKGVWKKDQANKNIAPDQYDILFDSEFVAYRLKQMLKQFLLPGVSKNYKTKLIKLITQILEDE